METAPSVSVIIPVFNDQTGLSACLQALDRQSYPRDRFEVIVVDNGSTPPIATAETHAFRLSLIRCDTPGSYAARNAGARCASGEALAFTDADCVPDEHWLEYGTAALLSAAAEVVVGGEVRMLDPPRKTAVAMYQSMVGFQQKENVEIRGFSVTANLFCSRKAFDLIGPFDERLLSGGDRDWGWRAKHRGIATVFAPDAAIGTMPRSNLRGAIRQARRVAAGRYHLKQTGLAAGNPAATRQNRGALASVSWILGHEGLGVVDRLRVLSVACIIRLAALFEQFRIRLGGAAERR